MAKAKTPNQKKAYERLNKRLAKYVAKVRAIYDTLNLEASKIATRTDYDVQQGKPFKWDDYPQTKDQVKKLQQRFVADLGLVIMSGTSQEWMNSNELQDLLADKVMRAYNVKRGDSRTKKYYQVNNDALQAFQQRRDNGMNLSDRLWNQAEDYKKGLEATLSTAIERGMSAVTLSKRVCKYLRDFDSLKKDYKKRFGTATDIHDCEYRSARLARSEINMAYRNAEQLRWQQMDFILGYEIKLSHSHPCHDICDDLKGKYPKDFKWTGWHPNDLCYVIPIIKTEEQFWLPKEERGKDNNEITDVPQGFKTWVANNQDRIARAEKRGTLPYFVRDNRERVKLKNKYLKESKSTASTSSTNAIRNRGETGPDTDAPKGKFLEYNLSKKDAISRLRDLAINYSHEEAYIYLPNNRVYHKVGILNKVPFSAEECKLLEGGVLMHNHPYETFSPEDIVFAIKHKIREIRVITPNKQYRAVIPQDFFENYNYTIIEDKVESIKDELSKQMLNFNSKKYEKYLMNYHNYAMREFFKREGFKYFVNSL